MANTVAIQSDDFWVKVVEMLQQNWALIEPMSEGGVRVYFIGDTGGVFDEFPFPSADDAIAALRRNGFKHFADDEELQSFLRPPEPPFHQQPHPNGPIYSSGRYWVE
jgi:hypothetical protein